jgi:hypothetical protein
LPRLASQQITLWFLVVVLGLAERPAAP